MQELRIEEKYPLQETWERTREAIGLEDRPEPTGLTRETYLDAAERIVRALASWLDGDGIIVDPFSKEEFYAENRSGRKLLVHAQTRFLGGLGHLIAAGRCLDLVETCIQIYEERLLHLDQVQLAPEFWVKEMVYAHAALRDRVSEERRQRWEEAWRNHDPWTSYVAAKEGVVGNYNLAVFALAGEFFKQRYGLGGDGGIVGGAIRYLARDFTPWGMYRDPSDPMTYDLVVKQQLDMIRHRGYAGEHAGWIDEICRRGAISSLLMQSSTGQMPFGGRSNQFHFVEAHFACLCESRAAFYKTAGDELTAGIFKRAGRRAVQMTLPWILEMEPFRHTKQGFHPELGHGVDSGGPYSVYGSLAASLLGAAYHLADEDIEEETTPAEMGGFAFALWPAFHKVFASCGGYHVEVDTRADREKDGTGLGRLQRIGVRSEIALAGSISPDATFSFGVERPTVSLAIGPVWWDSEGRERRLADFSDEISDVEFTVLREMPEEVAFEVRYTGELGGCCELTESYVLSDRGLEYAVRCEPKPERLHLLVPVILTDGEVEGEFIEEKDHLRVDYRGSIYRINLRPDAEWVLRDDPPAANRNALYRALEIRFNEVSLELGQAGK
jgi:hypothetical protein